MGSISIAPYLLGERIFDDLLDQRAETVDRVRLFERATQGKKSLTNLIEIVGCVALARRKASPQPYLPVHGRDAILDDVDGASHHRRLRKSAEIYRCGFWQRLSRKLHGAQNCRERQRLACCVAICRVNGNTDSAGSQPPQSAQLFSYLHALPSFRKRKRHGLGKTMPLLFNNQLSVNSDRRVPTSCDIL